MAVELEYEIRDPVHGLIHLTEQEIRIINTPVFQRLRRIRQLAMADLVYPGALHTRFEHALGTMHVAHRIFSRLQRLDNSEHVYDDDVVAVRLAALLHDIGHGPFSHVSEYLVEKYCNRAALGSLPATTRIHERLTMDTITNATEVASLLTKEQRERVITVIQGAGQRDFRRDIISSSLDADKMDYLLRDAYHAGVHYGHYDLDKIIDACRVVRQGSETYLMISEDGRFAAEQLLLAKYYMTQQVYRHRVRVITDSMIVRGLELAIEADPEIRAVYAYDGSMEHLQQYLAMDDARMIAAMLSSGDLRAREIFQRLRDRRLFKELAFIPLDPANVDNAVILGRLLGFSDHDSRSLELAVAAARGYEAWQVIVEKTSIKHPAYHTPGRIDPEPIFVVSRISGTPRSLGHFPELVDAKQQTSEHLHVIAPRDDDPNLSLAAKPEAKSALEEEIRQLVFKHVGGAP